MAHIHLPEGVPGIRGPMVISPETTSRCVSWRKSYFRTKYPHGGRARDDRNVCVVGK